MEETEPPTELAELEKTIAQLSEEKRQLVQDQDYEKAAFVRDKVAELRRRKDEFNAKWKEKGLSGRKTVTKDDVCSIISNITGIPVDQLDKGETKKLLEMEK
ncbi:MAG: UvrB/UvrC motif-containing protein, partial [Treponema sp.]|nr:UvrB/UvrC motif-containing protein [Treponema sp.]